MAELTKELGPCRVRSGSDSPCPRPATVKIWGIPFCERCAREQEAYFAIGELTQKEEEMPRLLRSFRGPRDERLAEVLGSMRRERTSYAAGAAEMEEVKVPIGSAA